MIFVCTGANSLDFLQRPFCVAVASQSQGWDRTVNNTGRENVMLITRKENGQREESDLIYEDFYWSSALVHLFIHTFYSNEF